MSESLLPAISPEKSGLTPLKYSILPSFAPYNLLDKNSRLLKGSPMSSIFRIVIKELFVLPSIVA
jgi:hypothetical protein